MCLHSHMRERVSNDEYTCITAGETVQPKGGGMSSKGSNALVATEKVRSIRDCIFTIRGAQVMLDRDLAAIYQVSTSAFNQAVKRNIGRFPPEFRFQLTREEHRFLMSQIVISKRADGLETRGVVIEVVTSRRGNKLSATDIAKFNAQYGGLTETVWALA